MKKTKQRNMNGGGHEYFDSENRKVEHMEAGALSSPRVLGIFVAACVCYLLYFLILSSTEACGILNPCQRTADSTVDPSFDVFDRELLFDSNTVAADDSESEDSDTSLDSDLIPSSSITYVNAAGTEREQGLGNIVFGIAASARFWEKRKEYVKLWWRKGEMRGFVWMDKPVKNWSPELPPMRISQDTSRFNYTNKRGNKAAIRISRVVSETFRIGLPDVDWFVMGDDDTVFVPENLVKVLSKYDHKNYYYIGSHSESHTQNIHFSYNMAYGGGGFAISYPLAKALESIQDRCIQKYTYLYGSDDRMQACMAELGVPLTKEMGFHQFDVYGDAFGLLAAHPVTPLVSIHHLDIIDPIFPNATQVQSLRHLKKAITVDPSGILQQSMCYNKWKSWSISVSWGYAVQIYRGLIPPRTLELPSRTFLSWYRRSEDISYPFSTRPASKSPCEQPVIFYMKDVGLREDGKSISTYVKSDSPKRRATNDCKIRMSNPEDIQLIRLVKEESQPSLHQAPRRQCCRIVKSSVKSMEMSIGNCADGEAIG